LLNKLLIKLVRKRQILEEMNAYQVRESISDATVALLILGACENHGDHMPFGCDNFVPLELAKRVAKQVQNAIVLPAIPYGVSSHHGDFQMTITLQPQTLIMAIQDICYSLIKNGIKRVLFLNGHDGNIAPIEVASRSIKDNYPNVVLACLEAWWTLGTYKKIFSEWSGLGHGGEAETSVMLSVRPALVDMQRAPDKTIPNIPNNVRIYWKFSELTNSGSTGSPRQASRSKGDKALNYLEKMVVQFVKNMDRNDWKYGLGLAKI
jgi:creatinine amidohydrolase